MPESAEVLVINGPNLNLLGVREPDKYGTTTLAELEEQVTKVASELGLTVRFVQSNHEGDLIDAIHAAHGKSAGIVINPAGFGPTSIALRDALTAVPRPTVEVHITNVHKREAFRHHSHISAAVDALIIGAGTHGYLLAVRHIAHLTAEHQEKP